MTDEPVVLCDIDARGVAMVTINRPRVNNAYNGEVVDALLEGALALDADPNVRLVVIRGNGRHFQAGADLKWLKAVSRPVGRGKYRGFAPHDKRDPESGQLFQADAGTGAWRLFRGRHRYCRRLRYRHCFGRRGVFDCRGTLGRHGGADLPAAQCGDGIT